MQEADSLWVYGPFTEDNRIAGCESGQTNGGSAILTFEDGRSVDFPESMIPALLTVLGICDVAALANMAVRLRSVPADGYLALAPDLFIAPIPAGETMQFGIRQLNACAP